MESKNSKNPDVNPLAAFKIDPNTQLKKPVATNFPPSSFTLALLEQFLYCR